MPAAEADAPTTSADPPDLLATYCREILNLGAFETLVLTPAGHVLERRLKVERSQAAIRRALAPYDLARFRVTVARYTASEDRVLIALVPLDAVALLDGPADDLGATLGRTAKGL